LEATKRVVSHTDTDAKCFKLCRGKNHVITTMVCMLMHDGDDRFSMGFGDTTSCDDWLFSDLVTIKTSDINAASCEVDDANVISIDTSIGTSVDKSAIVILALLVVGNIVRALVGRSIPISGMPSEVLGELSEVRSHIMTCNWMVLASRFADVLS